MKTNPEFDWRYPRQPPKNPYVSIGFYIYGENMYASLFDVKQKAIQIYHIELVTFEFTPSELMDMGVIKSSVKLLKARTFPDDITEEQVKLLISKDKNLLKAFKHTILDLMKDDVQTMIKDKVEEMKRDKVLRDYDWYKKWIIDDFKYPNKYYYWLNKDGNQNQNVPRMWQ